MQIRAARSEDWPALWQIVEPIVRAGETYTYPTDLTGDRARELWLAGPPVETWVAEDDGVVLATVRTSPNKPGHGDHVGTAAFMVAPAARGRGVAAALAEHVVVRMRAQGYRGIQFNAVVETNTSAVRLWERLGWRIVGTVPEAFRSPSRGLVGLHVMYRSLV
ncbi:GNAT family N-acetyltransferase [Isoptericola chiayiensis]|uniref:GNAT family N-acetyltransferase n=1 Tax=Isoptericola chiayiensis TaxID=579446 RepID=A0ABP8YLW9_9MICO|nr:GNAT superfamily N-acetyltransferase [Isoptericola chiayiensis]